MKIPRVVKIGFIYGIVACCIFFVQSLTHLKEPLPEWVTPKSTSERIMTNLIDLIPYFITFFIVGVIAAVVIKLAYKIFSKFSQRQTSYFDALIIGFATGLVLALIFTVPLMIFCGGESYICIPFMLPAGIMEFIANWMISGVSEPIRIVVGALIGYPILNTFTALLYEYFRRKEQSAENSSINLNP
jgi:hypothetical protein